MNEAAYENDYIAAGYYVPDMSNVRFDGDRPASEGIEELVPSGAGCPSCGEQRCDMLVWRNGEDVVCVTCGAVYDPWKELTDEVPRDGG